MHDSPNGFAPKLAELRALLKKLGSVLVCYSGGTDSAFLLAVATSELGNLAIGLTALSPSLAQTERADAERIARSIGAVHRFVETREFDLPEYTANGPDRCLHCKSVLYQVAEEKRREWDLSVILNGTNVDDLGDYRPGNVAAEKAGVRSPLVELGFTKADVRAAARLLGLDVWDKPAAACLSSRIPYGTPVTPERLTQVEQLEATLRELGFGQLRVRWHHELARIEIDLVELERVLSPGLRERIVEAGKSCGFAFVTLDLAGYRQGSHNELLRGRSLRVV
ncbi:MAG: ATP-dependent sacrificial sulfur transferase LarE [Polyangiaceae bacterium]|nr:ATP-dependent sacrificial sulfur transferase LarE [Polyangiaceae bacterium]